MSYKFDFAFMADRWPDFVAGAWLTVQLTVLSIALGFALGTLCALARVYGGPVLRRLAHDEASEHSGPGPTWQQAPSPEPASS